MIVISILILIYWLFCLYQIASLWTSKWRIFDLFMAFKIYIYIYIYNYLNKFPQLCQLAIPLIAPSSLVRATWREVKVRLWLQNPLGARVTCRWEIKFPQFSNFTYPFTKLNLTSKYSFFWSLCLRVLHDWTLERDAYMVLWFLLEVSMQSSHPSSAKSCNFMWFICNALLSYILLSQLFNLY